MSKFNANPDHFFKAFELCLKNNFSDVQARIMADGFDKRGFVDASNGCMHFVMRYKITHLNCDNMAL